jgi:hypothetical protein
MVFLEAFILTEEPPEPALDGYTMTSRSGIFAADRLPTVLRFGTYLELAADDDECGSFSVRIDAEFEPDTRPLISTSIDIAEPDPDWSMARIKVLPFEINFHVGEEVEFALAVYVNDDFIGDKLIKVCRTLDVPDYPSL